MHKKYLSKNVSYRPRPSVNSAFSNNFVGIGNSAFDKRPESNQAKLHEQILKNKENENFENKSKVAIKTGPVAISKMSRPPKSTRPVHLNSVDGAALPKGIGF